MEKQSAGIEGVFVITPRIFTDPRGYFFESFNEREFRELIGDVRFVQDNQSQSVRGVMRGLHFQIPPYSQAKLVRCVVGSVLDVALDLRRGSDTFGKHVAVELSEENKRMLYIPRGFAHGFSVLSDVAVFQYKCDNYYNPEAEAGINILDDSLGIDWRLDGMTPLLSPKDMKHPLLADFDTPF